MGLKEIVKRIYHTFFAVWSLMCIIVCLFALFLELETIPADFLFALFFLAFLSSLTYIVFYSKNELTLRQLIIRFAIQFLLVLAIVLSVGYIIGWVGPKYPIQSFAIVASTLVIYIAVTVFELYQTWTLADKLNMKLKERSGE